MRETRAGFRVILVGAWLAVFGLLPAGAQDAASIWQQVEQTRFDPEKTASVENVSLARDRIRLTLVSGKIQFSLPALGLVYGAAFRGKGRVEIIPPTETEARQLGVFIGKPALAMDFTEATITFSDETYEEVGSQVHWKASPDMSLEELYRSRQVARENEAAELVPRIFKSILSENRKRTALFAVDLKTDEKGWIRVRFDALEPEEISVGRWARIGSSGVFDRWLSFPSDGRNSSEAHRDPQALDDFVIQRCRIEATVTAGAELNAVTHLTLRSRSSGERALLFALDANLRVGSVKNEAGETLVFFQPRNPKDRPQSYGDYVAVVLPAPLKENEEPTVEFSYGGERVIQKVGPGNYFCQSMGWYPSLPDSFASRTDFDMTFRSPKQNTLVATGEKVAESTDGDWAVTHWKSGMPLAVAGFAFGDFKVYREKVGNVIIEAYANPQPDDQMRAILSIAGAAPVGTLSPAAMIKPMGIELGNMVRLFENFFGPYPYNRLAVTNIPYSYGQGWPTLIYLSALSFLDSTQRNAFRITRNIELTDFFRAHETSHQWWGHRVGWKSYHDQWLSEGFAQFSGNLYVLFRQSEKEYVSRLKEDKESILNKDEKGRVYETLGPIWMGTRLASSDSPRAYATVVYNKGGLVVNAIRSMLYNSRGSDPDQLFKGLMQDFCRTYDNRAASTEDFKALLEKHMIPAMDLEGNGRMDWFFRQYVYGTGIPEYELQWNVGDAGGGRWKVTGNVMQKGVPAGWMDALALYVQNSGKVSRLGLLGIRKQESPFEITLPFKPEKLILNHLEDTPAVIR